MSKTVDEAWAAYEASPTLENARVYDEAVAAAEENVSHETLAICFPCGNKYGRGGDGVVTASLGHCDWCGANDVSVVPPSDFGHPRLHRPA